MENLFSDQLHDRIIGDLSAFDEAQHSLESIVNPNAFNLPGHGLGNRGALLDILELLGIKDAQLSEGEDIMDQFKEILNQNNYTYTVVKLEDNWWKNSNGHMLGVSRNTDMFVPLYSKHFSYYFLKAGEHGVSSKIKITSKTANELYDFAYCFFKTLPSKSLTMKDLGRFALSSIPKFRLWCVILISIVVSILNMGIPFATKYIFDEVIPSGQANGAWGILVVLLNIAIVFGLFTVVRDIAFLGIKDVVSVNTQAALIDRLFHLKTSFFRDKSAGSASDEVLAASKASGVLSESIITSVFSLIIAVSFFIQIGIYSHFTLITFVIYLLLIFEILALWASVKVRLNIRLQKEPENSRLTGLMFNFMQGLQKIKTNGAEAKAFKIFTRQYSKTEIYSFHDAVLPEIPGALTALCMLFIVIIVPYSDMTVSDYAAFFSAFAGVTAAVSQMIPNIGQVASIYPIIKIMEPILEAEPEVEESSKIVRSLSGSINVSGLRFRYDENMPYILDGITFNIRQGDYVAIVGNSGCGKSTLLRLLLGFEIPESGSVFYDQYNVYSVNKSSLRQHIGICLQGGKLFSGTIMDNIRIANPMASEEEVWEACRIAAIDDEIRNMPDGIYHQLNASGQGISGGQRQRILIARAVLNKPSVLFLDEATSALDNISQKRVIDNLEAMHCTRITIAHRLSTIRDCDRIIVLDKGHIAEDGTFDELLKNGGLFSEIAKRQQL